MGVIARLIFLITVNRRAYFMVWPHFATPIFDYHFLTAAYVTIFDHNARNLPFIDDYASGGLQLLNLAVTCYNVVRLLKQC